MKAKSNCCCCGTKSGEEQGCAPAAPLPPPESWQTGTRETEEGPIPQIADTLDAADRRGAIRVRMGIGRDRYRVEPGLYALGSPNANSPVFVTANYKLSFDHLRSALEGRAGWILVLDTDGVNVWCAAGKGTFGTDELVHRISQTGLAKIVAHRQLIVPQLGATGVAAHLVTNASGFNVIYGPVRATDLPAFLDADCQAVPEMRRVSFALRDRIVVIPNELTFWAQWGLPVIVILALLGQAQLAGVLLGASLAGIVLVPVLLPWLPGKAFSVKGMTMGLLLGVPGVWAIAGTTGASSAAGLLLIAVSCTSFIALNFTGCSTFTSLTGTRSETLRAVPIQIVGFIVGLGLFGWAAWL